MPTIRAARRRSCAPSARPRGSPPRASTRSRPARPSSPRPLLHARASTGCARACMPRSMRCRHRWRPRDPEAAAFDARRTRSAAEPWCDEDDSISGAQISALTSGGQGGTDTVHRLVMDMHKALNALQARIASETIDGAHAYGMADERPAAGRRVHARREPHGGPQVRPPGPGDDRDALRREAGDPERHRHDRRPRAGGARRGGPRDAHLHRRAPAAPALLPGPVRRLARATGRTRSRAPTGRWRTASTTCASARYAARGAAELEEYLAFLGSRLVFLIDWNRARKRLRLLLPKKEVMELLKWAADNDHGHMAFLRAGGEQMIFDCARLRVAGAGLLRRAAGRRARARRRGELHALRGAHLRRRALLGGRPEALVRDEVRAELVNYFRTAQESVLDIAAEHAAVRARDRRRHPRRAGERRHRRPGPRRSSATPSAPRPGSTAPTSW